MFFGTDDRRLFGMYHAPTGTTIRDAGVVLCYSGPHEYTQLHWAYQKLAGLLAAAGLHVMRFDYSGTGDSFGSTAESTLSHWVDDIATAAAELREVAGIRRVGLVGARLGGALVMQAVASGVKARDVVLWDPVIRGTDYVARLDAAEDFRLRLLNYPEPNTRTAGELLGYPFTDAQRAETSAVALTDVPIGRVDRMLVIGTALSAAQREYVTYVEREGVEVTASEIDDPSFHAPDRHPNDPILSHNIPVAITAFLTRSGA